MAYSQKKNKLYFEKAVLSNWKLRSIGPSGLGRISAIGVSEKYPSVIYLGTAGGGIWKTIDGGIHWRSVFDGQPVLAIGAIAVQKDNPDKIWVGTGDGNMMRNSMGVRGNGIYKSEDGGNTWKCMGLEKAANI